MSKQEFIQFATPALLAAANIDPQVGQRGYPPMAEVCRVAIRQAEILWNELLHLGYAENQPPAKPAEEQSK